MEPSTNLLKPQWLAQFLHTDSISIKPIFITDFPASKEIILVT